MMKREKLKGADIKDKEVKILPAMEMIECERAAYVKEMEEYLSQLKRMKKSDAKKKSFDNLLQSRIVHENGEFTEHYEYAKMILQEKM